MSGSILEAPAAGAPGWSCAGAALLLLALVACTSDRDRLIEQGHSPAFADGYQDGCESGQQAGGGSSASYTRDAARFGTDRDYARGWTAAFTRCAGEEQARALELQEQREARQQRQTQAPRGSRGRPGTY